VERGKQMNTRFRQASARQADKHGFLPSVRDFGFVDDSEPSHEWLGYSRVSQGDMATGPLPEAKDDGKAAGDCCSPKRKRLAPDKIFCQSCGQFSRGMKNR
jgi:hypothetical protein